MKISYDWLKDYTKVTLDSQRLAHKLTLAGLEVEKIEEAGGDTVFELEITPNRPDCLNHLGIAREISAILNKPLKIPKIKKIKWPAKKADIAIDDKKGCLRYVGTVIQNVSAKESPGWIKERLNSIGLRAVNNIVDITNFCLMETGQPLHAFDYDKLIGGKIIVRHAKDGETITTIDGVLRKLDSSILVIADSKRPVAIAGIMGGKETEVTEKTKNVLLESAYFDPILIRRAARKLGLKSDSSYRFERGVDMSTVLKASERAASLILEHAGGRVTTYNDVYPNRVSTSKRIITINKSEIDNLLGTSLPLNRCKAILDKLGFKVTAQKNILKITAPSFRNDVAQSVDVIEEIARVIGYDASPVSLPQIKASLISEDQNRNLREAIANDLAAQGLNEAISYTMISAKSLERTNLRSDVLKVKNPLTVEQECMRSSLLPGLLSAVLTNFNRGQKDLKLFEVGKIYLLSGEEKEMLGVILAGNLSNDWLRPGKEDAGFYDLKGVIERALEKTGLKKLGFKPVRESFLDVGQGAGVILSGQRIGALGAVAKGVLTAWDIKQKGIFFAEIDLAAIYANAKLQDRYQPLSGFPAIVRDISLAVKNDVTFENIRGIAYETGGEFLTAVKLIEQYLGEKIPSGHRGMTLSLTYQSPSRTLREEEVNRLYDQFSAALSERLGAIKR